MKELATLPTSIRQRLELAETLTQQNRPEEAKSVLGQAALELAKTAPELCALVLAAACGAKSVAGRIQERKTTMERVQSNFLGIVVYDELIPVETRTTTDFEFLIRW